QASNPPRRARARWPWRKRSESEKSATIENASVFSRPRGRKLRHGADGESSWLVRGAIGGRARVFSAAGDASKARDTVAMLAAAARFGRGISFRSSSRSRYECTSLSSARPTYVQDEYCVTSASQLAIISSALPSV